MPKWIFQKISGDQQKVWDLVDTCNLFCIFEKENTMTRWSPNFPESDGHGLFDLCVRIFLEIKKKILSKINKVIVPVSSVENVWSEYTVIFNWNDMPQVRGLNTLKVDKCFCDLCLNCCKSYT